jgi:hypothetical protein
LIVRFSKLGDGAGNAVLQQKTQTRLKLLTGGQK